MQFRDVHFKPFRREVIERLVAKCPNQHGLLVNHTMGTGKTKTGLLFLANFPKFPKLIIAPTSAHNEWVSGKHIKSPYKLITPEKLPRQLITKKTIVVFDECHRLMNLFNVCFAFDFKSRFSSSLDLGLISLSIVFQIFCNSKFSMILFI